MAFDTSASAVPEMKGRRFHLFLQLVLHQVHGVVRFASLWRLAARRGGQLSRLNCDLSRPPLNKNIPFLRQLDLYLVGSLTEAHQRARIGIERLDHLDNDRHHIRPLSFFQYRRSLKGRKPSPLVVGISGGTSTRAQ